MSRCLPVQLTFDNLRIHADVTAFDLNAFAEDIAAGVGSAEVNRTARLSAIGFAAAASESRCIQQSNEVDCSIASGSAVSLGIDLHDCLFGHAETRREAAGTSSSPPITFAPSNAGRRRSPRKSSPPKSRKAISARRASWK